MKILLLQSDIAWCNPRTNSVENQNLIAKTISQTEGQLVDMILLPEMFSTGFCVEPQGVAERDNFSLKWMQQIAKQYDCVVVGSVAVEENEAEVKYFNRQFFVYPDTSYVHYDKRHLFSYGGEHNFYSAGNQRVIAEWRGWKILLQTCYDLRFPVFSRNHVFGDLSQCCDYEYDMAIYLASWPKSRISAWDTLLKARAIENQSFVIGLNRVGSDNNSIYSGNSAVIDFKGRVIESCSQSGEAEAIVAELDKGELDKFRAKFPTLIDDTDCRF